MTWYCIGGLGVWCRRLIKKPWPYTISATCKDSYKEAYIIKPQSYLVRFLHQGFVRPKVDSFRIEEIRV